MAASATNRLRLKKIGIGEELNTWGESLNGDFDLIDSAIAGLSTIALTGNYSLTSTNYAADEARSALLKFTGGGPWTVTIPSVSKNYLIWNACSAAVTITTGAGATASMAAGEIATIFCDASSVYKAKVTNYDGAAISGLADPAAPQDAATKAYADALAFAANAGILPGQGGSGGKFLGTDGTTASWAAPTVSGISDYASDQAAKAQAATARAIAFSLLF